MHLAGLEASRGPGMPAAEIMCCQPSSLWRRGKFTLVQPVRLKGRGKGEA